MDRTKVEPILHLFSFFDNPLNITIRKRSVATSLDLNSMRNTFDTFHNELIFDNFIGNHNSFFLIDCVAIKLIILTNKWNNRKFYL